MFYGILDLPWWGYIITLLITTHITIICVTVFLHRHQAHRALELHPIISHFFRAWLWLTTGMETKAWAAIHRKHHAKCETVEDPHSPQILGLKKVLWEGAELYRKEAKNKETLQRYGQGTPDDWIERNLYTPYSSKGIFVSLFIDLILFGVPGITLWALQMAWIPFFAAGVINGIGHYWGYRNFECHDASRNIVPWGILIGGEELHNNHHTYPTSAKLSNKWWECDIGWIYIKTLSLLRLAKIKRVAPKPVIIPDKKMIDEAGLHALLSNRIQVMTIYSKEVILPLFKLEKEKAHPEEQRLLKRIKPVLIREGLFMNDQGRSDLEQCLEKNGVLKTVYQYKEDLKSIWNKTTASQTELLDALQDWCVQAEATGIHKLQNFVKYLKGYTIIGPD